MQTMLYSLKTPAALAALRTFDRALRSTCTRLRDPLRRRRLARGTHRALSALDAHLLRDLGIDRSEIASIANNPFDSQRARLMQVHGLGTMSAA